MAKLQVLFRRQRHERKALRIMKRAYQGRLAKTRWGKRIEIVMPKPTQEWDSIVSKMNYYAVMEAAN